MNPPDQANAGAPSGSRGGHAFNLALALLVAVSVLVSAGLSHRLVAIHTRSLAIGRDIAELRQLAHQLRVVRAAFSSDFLDQGVEPGHDVGIIDAALGTAFRWGGGFARRLGRGCGVEFGSGV